MTILYDVGYFYHMMELLAWQRIRDRARTEKTRGTADAAILAHHAAAVGFASVA